MRFERVEAHAFGALRDESLQFARGMNVVHGPNEAGKSTWHAALYLGLCGMRQGKGKKKEDQDLEGRHRPWDRPEAWDVGLTVRLEDGRRIELRHDFATKLASVKDADIAERDYGSEVFSEGAPDGARWLGLNRRSFLQSACVRQADVLAVRDNPGGLQEDLQSAASSAERDATAARALAALADFHKERIGTSRAPTKPLVQSQKAAAAARQQLEAARKTNAEYRATAQDVERLETEVRECGRQLGIARAAQARRRADAVAVRLAAARELAAEFPNGAPPPVAGDAEQAARIAAAIATWDHLPGVRNPEGETLPALAQQASAAEDALAAAMHAKPSRTPSLAAALAVAALLCLGAVVVAFAELMVVGAVPAALAVAVLWWASRQAKRDSERRIAHDIEERGERHRSLIRAMNHRRREDDDYRDDLRRQAEAAQQLHEAATAVGLAGDSPEAERAALADWQARRPERLAAAESAQRRWSELSVLLGGQPIEALQAECELRKQEAANLAAGRGRQDWEAAERLPPVADLAERERRAQVELAKRIGTLSNHPLADVAEAEDACAAAERNVERVERLDATINTTIRFLRDAEETVHRDVARTLRATMLRWLGAVTGGAYADCRVNPETLAVEVRAAEGPWRNAELLSHGTAEQIYLVARLALVQHLTAKKEACPLILDDVVSASDGVRSRAILETLLAISGTTQVVLFSHDDSVREWARERLADTPDHRLIDLTPPRSMGRR